MKIIEEPALGLLLIQPNVFEDDRGHFFESYNLKSFIKEVPGAYEFTQDNVSKSKANTIRGMHYQKQPHTQAKLVSCLNGSIIDVVLDLRENSDTYGQHFSFILNDLNCLQLLVPTGFAHGFLAAEDNTVVSYKCDEFYKPSHDGGIHYNSFGYDWGVKNPIVSAKDLELPEFTNQKIRT